MTKEFQVKTTKTKKTTRKPTPEKVKKTHADEQEVILKPSVFANGQYCAAIRVERKVA